MSYVGLFKVLAPRPSDAWIMQKLQLVRKYGCEEAFPTLMLNQSVILYLNIIPIYC